MPLFQNHTRPTRDRRSAVARSGFSAKRLTACTPARTRKRRAALDIAVARLRRGRRKAERHDAALLAPRRRRMGNGVAERGFVGDDVVGRQQQDNASRIFRGDHQRSNGRRRRRVAAHRFQHDGVRRHADFLHLLGDQEAMHLAAQKDRRLRARHLGAQHGILNHRLRAVQRQKLFGQGGPRQRPQARAAAAGQDDGIDRSHVGTQTPCAPMIAIEQTFIAGAPPRLCVIPIVGSLS